MKSVLIFLIVVGLYVGYLIVHPRRMHYGNPVLVEIPKGKSAWEIAKILEEKEVISSPTFFLFMAQGLRVSKTLKAGPYLLERNHYYDAVKKIAEGRTVSVKFTIPEGLTSYEIANKLFKEGLIQSASSFVELVRKNDMEGMLYPETYFFSKMTLPEDLMNAMVSMLRQNYTTAYGIRAQSLNFTLKEVLTLASIIEKEAEVDEERATISSVYHNRLKKGILLQADPTVQYALSGGKYWKGKLTYKDLKVESPYNTYLHVGFPPGPICNPGKKSIEAALYPVETKYLYFVSTGNKTHNFFVTYKEHLNHQLKK